MVLAIYTHSVFHSEFKFKVTLGNTHESQIFDFVAFHVKISKSSMKLVLLSFYVFFSHVLFKSLISLSLSLNSLFAWIVIDCTVQEHLSLNWSLKNESQNLINYFYLIFSCKLTVDGFPDPLPTGDSVVLMALIIRNTL